MTITWATVAMLLAWLLLAAGCGGSVPENSSSGPAATSRFPMEPTPVPAVTPSPSPAQALAPLDKGAPDFRFMLFQGKDELGASEMSMSELKGRPLVLNFWARLCTPCWTEMPELQDFYEEYAERVQLVGIDVGQFTGLGSPKDAGKLLNSLGITYPAGYTDDARVVRDYRIQAMPTTAFITAGGEVFRTWTGSITRNEVTAIVREMLEEE